MSIPLFIHRLSVRSVAIASSVLVLNSCPAAAQVSDLQVSNSSVAIHEPTVAQPVFSTPVSAALFMPKVAQPIHSTATMANANADETKNAISEAVSDSSVDEWPELQLAQNLAGQCRQTRRLERIYNNANLAAARLRDVPGGTRLTLAGSVNQPDFGWIRISQPVNGFILTAFLVPCFSTPAPPPVPAPSPPTGPTIGCGIAQANLAINTQPNTQAFTIGGLSPGQGFRITGTRVTQTVPPIEQGRIWTPIERFGTRGWIAETGPGGFGQNIRSVSCGSIGL